MVLRGTWVLRAGRGSLRRARLDSTGVKFGAHPVSTSPTSADRNQSPRRVRPRPPSLHHLYAAKASFYRFFARRPVCWPDGIQGADGPRSKRCFSALALTAQQIRADELLAVASVCGDGAPRGSRRRVLATPEPEDYSTRRPGRGLPQVGAC